MRLREVRQVLHCHTARKWQSHYARSIVLSAICHPYSKDDMS